MTETTHAGETQPIPHWLHNKLFPAPINLGFPENK